MSYFTRFPFILDYEVQGQQFHAIDITRRNEVVAKSKNNPRSYFEYSVQDGETPEMLADRVYDDSSLYWVIMLFNDIYNIHTDWPLSYNSLIRFIVRKYGNKLYDTHHYIAASTGAIVDADYHDYDRIPITNYEYEVKVNDDKRNIKVPDPRIVPSFISEHNRKISR